MPESSDIEILLDHCANGKLEEVASFCDENFSDKTSIWKNILDFYNSQSRDNILKSAFLKSFKHGHFDICTFLIEKYPALNKIDQTNLIDMFSFSLTKDSNDYLLFLNQKFKLIKFKDALTQHFMESLKNNQFLKAKSIFDSFDLNHETLKPFLIEKFCNTFTFKSLPEIQHFFETYNIQQINFNSNTIKWLFEKTFSANDEKFNFLADKFEIDKDIANHLFLHACESGNLKAVESIMNNKNIHSLIYFPPDNLRYEQNFNNGAIFNEKTKVIALTKATDNGHLPVIKKILSDCKNRNSSIDCTYLDILLKQSLIHGHSHIIDYLSDNFYSSTIPDNIDNFISTYNDDDKKEKMERAIQKLKTHKYINHHLHSIKSLIKTGMLSFAKNVIDEYFKDLDDYQKVYSTPLFKIACLYQHEHIIDYFINEKNFVIDGEVRQWMDKEMRSQLDDEQTDYLIKKVSKTYMDEILPVSASPTKKTKLKL